MTSRISKTFQRLRREHRKALIPFITAGDPDLSATKRLIEAIEKGGADILEIGVPFSDPMADGPVIQRASERALRHGATLKKILNLVAAVRRRGVKSPILLMGYYNPILAYGLKRYARDAARAGVDGTLVVDLPPEESKELDDELRKAGIDLIYLLTPTSDAERIRKVAGRARGFIYFVSITGITGAKLRLEKEIHRKVLDIRRQTSLPIAVGFGISRPEQAAKMAKFADGVVIGSALVSLISLISLAARRSGSMGLFRQVERFIRNMRRVL